MSCRATKVDHHTSASSDSFCIVFHFNVLVAPNIVRVMNKVAQLQYIVVDYKVTPLPLLAVSCFELMTEPNI